MNLAAVISGVSMGTNTINNGTVKNQGTDDYGFGSILKGVQTNVTDVNVPIEEIEISEETLATLQDILEFLDLKNVKELENEEEIAGQFMPDVDTNVESLLSSFFADGTVENDFSKLTEELDLDLNEEIDPSNLVNLYSIISSLADLSEKEWANLDLNSTSTVLKFAKIQELLSGLKDVTSDEAEIGKNLNKLFETISGKLGKLVENKLLNSSQDNPSFNKLLASNPVNDTRKSTYSQVANVIPDNESTLEVSNLGITNESTQQVQPYTLPMSKLEQFVLTVEKSGQPVSQEEFIEAFETILSKAKLSSANGTQKLMINLNPEHLGSLRIEIIQKDNRMTARIMTTTIQAKELLESQLSRLKQSFTAQGIQTESIEITQQSSSLPQEKFSQQDSESNKQQNQEKKDKDVEEDIVQEFNDQFEEALLNLKV